MTHDITPAPKGAKPQRPEPLDERSQQKEREHGQRDRLEAR